VASSFIFWAGASRAVPDLELARSVGHHNQQEWTP
jgi:hypothetical protein